jgi:two-component system NtrC family sensor kinase
MKRRIFELFGGSMRMLLIASFSLIAAFTLAIGAVSTARVISDYLSVAEDEQVDRDMKLADVFYQQRLKEIFSITYHLANNPTVIQNFQAAQAQDPQALKVLLQEAALNLGYPHCTCSNMVVFLDQDGNVVGGEIRTAHDAVTYPLYMGSFAALPIVQSVLSQGESFAATEILDAEILTQVGLQDKARIELVPTDRAAPQLFDQREGQAGLSLVSVHPMKSAEGALVGAVLSAYIFNNDFTLVDQIKDIAGIDTVTIFFGDLRVSTNVLNEDGSRAVGTRVSQEVYDTVLVKGETYQGRAFVVNQWYITRYEPLYDHLGGIVGSLYVGSRVSAFEALIHAFNQRVAVIAFITLVLAAVIAVPISAIIISPVVELADANQQLADGDLTVRVPDYGKGALGTLGRSFNDLASTLDHTQQELLRQEKLASIGQLAAGVAHEINNPLGTILLLGDVLHNQTPENTPEREDLKLMIDEAMRAKRIVADLLNFARQQEVLAQETDLNALLGQVVAALKVQPIFQQVEIVTQFTDQLPSIQADPDQLQQVFINLMNNAAEAMDGQGVITLQTALQDQFWVEVKITDTGPGIPKENMSKVFTPFFTTKEVGKGTGLGLSIVYGIIKLHRGQIAVQSEVGRGTTFIITLPLRIPAS